jgi:hypothetical protein
MQPRGVSKRISVRFDEFEQDGDILEETVAVA